MIIMNIHKYAGWYASYMEDNQGRALIECQSKKIKQLTKLIETISGEIELSEQPKEYDEKMILNSIKALIEQPRHVEHSIGYFRWEG